MADNPRDFDNCAYVSRTGKHCGALRWYHDDHARHKFVEPERTPTDAERADKLERMLVTVIDANYGISYHDIGNGDGITETDAEEIRLWWKSRLEAIEQGIQS